MKLLPVILLTSMSLGCAVGAAQQDPGARRRPLPWQQFCEQSWSVPQASAMAQARGAEGWELVAMYNGVLCYKRPAPGAEPTAPGAPREGGPMSTVPAVRDPGF